MTEYYRQCLRIEYVGVLHVSLSLDPFGVFVRQARRSCVRPSLLKEDDVLRFDSRGIFPIPFFVRKIRPMLFSPAPIRWIGAAINAMLIRLCRDVPVNGAPFVFF